MCITGAVAGVNQEDAQKTFDDDETTEWKSDGSRKPTKYEVVKKIAEALNTTPEYLLGNSGMLVLAAQEQGGAKAAREIDELVSEVSGMFAGGSLSEDALDGAMQALTRAYWIAKEKNKKYTPRKYRKEQTEE